MLPGSRSNRKPFLVADIFVASTLQLKLETNALRVFLHPVRERSIELGRSLREVFGAVESYANGLASTVEGLILQALVLRLRACWARQVRIYDNPSVGFVLPLEKKDG